MNLESEVIYETYFFITKKTQLRLTRLSYIAKKASLYRRNAKIAKSSMKENVAVKSLLFVKTARPSQMIAKAVKN